jgi:hypothetical protein
MWAFAVWLIPNCTSYTQKGEALLTAASPFLLLHFPQVLSA